MKFWMINIFPPCAISILIRKIKVSLLVIYCILQIQRTIALMKTRIVRRIQCMKATNKFCMIWRRKSVSEFKLGKNALFRKIDGLEGKNQ